MLRKLYAVVPSCARNPKEAESATAAMVSNIFPVIFIIGVFVNSVLIIFFYNETMAVNSIQVKRFLEFAAKSELNVKKL